jgi:8-oxo-dGTP pyrophosphatase MutT (NUDIX family)
MTTQPFPVKLYAKLIVLDEAGRVLVLRRSATHPKKALQWDLPGGVVNVAKGERPLSAARREAGEETGLSVGTIYAIGSFTEFHEYEPPTEIAVCGRNVVHAAHVYRTLDMHWTNSKQCPGLEKAHAAKPAEYCMGILGIARLRPAAQAVTLSSEHDRYWWLTPDDKSLFAKSILESLAPKYRVYVVSALGTTEPSRELVTT